MNYIEILKDNGLLDLDPNDVEDSLKMKSVEDILEEAEFLVYGKPASYYYNLFQQYGFNKTVQILKIKKEQTSQVIDMSFNKPELFNLAVQKSNIDTAKKLEYELNFKMRSILVPDEIHKIFNQIVSIYSPDIWFPLISNLYLVGLPEKDCREILQNKDINVKDIYYSIFGSNYKLFEDVIKNRIFLTDKINKHVTADDVSGLGDLIIELSKKYGDDIFNFFTDLYYLWLATPKEELEGLDFKDQLRKLFYSDIYNYSIDPIYYPILSKNRLLNNATNKKIESVFDKLKKEPMLGNYFIAVDFNPNFINNEEMRKWFHDYARKYGISESRSDIFKILGFAIKNFNLFLKNIYNTGCGDFNEKIANDIYFYEERFTNEEEFKKFFIERYNLENVEKGEIPFEYSPILIMSEVPISKEYIENNLELFQNAIKAQDFSLACFLVNLFGGKKLDPYILDDFNINSLEIPKNFDYNSKQAKIIRDFLNEYSDDKYNFSYIRDLRSLLINGRLQEEEEPSLILLENSNLSQDFREKIFKRYKDSKDIWPFLVKFPNLIGLDANLIRKKMDLVVDSANSFGVIDLEIINILSLFGSKFDLLNKYFKNKNPKINVSGLKQGYHDLISMLPAFIDDLIFKKQFNLDYVENFILKYFNELDDSLVKISLKYWNRLPIDVKKTQDKNIIFEYIKNEIVPELIGDAEIKHENLFFEAFKWNHLDDYANLENLYNIGQITPLPKWTNIGIIDLGKYIGYFLPRSDARAMFIGNYVTCCQQIGGEAEKSAIHSQISPFGALFVVENKKKKTLSAQSWVWSNGDSIVFDNIESPSGKAGASYNEEAMNEILDVYKTASKKIAKITNGPVFVGNSSYGVQSDFYDGLEPHRIHLVPEDSHVFLNDFYPEDTDKIELGYQFGSYETNSGLYLDSYYDKRRLANNKIRILKIANKIDRSAIDLSDKLERLLKNG